jgi:hypothetical protein
MENINSDVNTDSASSTESNETEVENSSVDTTATQNTDKKPDQPFDLKSVIGDALDKAGAEPEEEEETEEKPEKEETEVKPVTEGDKPEKKVEDKVETEDDKKPIPYDRFQEVIKEKNEAVEYRKSVEPKVQAYENTANFLQSYGVTPEEYQSWMDIAALSKVDPVQAMERLKPYLAQLQGATGDVLPKDLQEAVDAGHLTGDYAKELAKARSKVQTVEKQSVQTKEQQQKQQQAAWANQVQTSFESWLNGKIAADPTLKPVAKGQPGGKFEFVQDRILAMYSRGEIQLNNPQDIVTYAEKVLADVNEYYKRLQPKSKGPVTVRSSQSGSTNGAPKINSIKDAVSAGLAAAGRR